jgi:LPXTG cell wall anchor motif
MSTDAMEPITFFLVAAIIAAVGIGALYYRKRRNERQTVRQLLMALRDYRVLHGPLYKEQPLSASESVRGMRMRIGSTLEKLPESSKAHRPLREMHQACLSFLTQIGPTAVPEESDPLSQRWMAASGIRRRVLENALSRLRRILHTRMNELYKAYDDIEKPPPHDDEGANE